MLTTLPTQYLHNSKPPKLIATYLYHSICIHHPTPPTASTASANPNAKHASPHQRFHSDSRSHNSHTSLQRKSTIPPRRRATARSTSARCCCRNRDRLTEPKYHGQRHSSRLHQHCCRDWRSTASNKPRGSVQHLLPNDGSSRRDQLVRETIWVVSTLHPPEIATRT